MSIPDLKPGSELDALIAERVFGCRVIEIGSIHGADEQVFVCGCEPESDPQHYGPHQAPYAAASIAPFSTDIAAAWRVVERMRSAPEPRGLFLHGQEVFGWKAEFSRPGYRYEAEAEGGTAPYAICLAALKAMGVTV